MSHLPHQVQTLLIQFPVLVAIGKDYDIIYPPETKSLQGIKAEINITEINITKQYRD